MIDMVQWNRDNVQFIYICKGRRDDTHIALLVLLSLSEESEATLTCHVFWNYSINPILMRRKDNGINIKT